MCWSCLVRLGAQRFTVVGCDSRSRMLRIARRNACRCFLTRERTARNARVKPVQQSTSMIHSFVILCSPILNLTVLHRNNPFGTDCIANALLLSPTEILKIEVIGQARISCSHRFAAPEPCRLPIPSPLQHADDGLCLAVWQDLPAPPTI